jgi:tetratricopeptide (TPR) repeat protein
LARRYYLDTAAFARAHNDRFLEAGATVNLGVAAIQLNHYDEALDWSLSAAREAEDLGAENTAQKAAGNLGWAYLQLGDDERALDQFLKAEKSAEALGNVSSQLGWMSTAGYVYRNSGDLLRATESFRKALVLARQINSKEDIEHALEDLAQVSVDSGKLDEASSYLDQVTPMELAGGNNLTANVLLTQGMLAAARRQNPQTDAQTSRQLASQAESLFRAVRDDANNPTTTRLGAGQQLARLFASQGNTQAAEQMLKVSLADFESARAQLKSEESTLPFVANAAHIYDD